jgi:hypothetical protein
VRPLVLHVPGRLAEGDEARTRPLDPTGDRWWLDRARIPDAPADAVRLDGASAIEAAVADGLDWADALGVREYEERPSDRPDVVAGRRRVDARLAEGGPGPCPIDARPDGADLAACIAALFHGTWASTERVVLSWRARQGDGIGCTVRDTEKTPAQPAPVAALARSGDGDGAAFWGPRPSSSSIVHLHVHEATGLAAIVHAHPPFLVAAPDAAPAGVRRYEGESRSDGFARILADALSSGDALLRLTEGVWAAGATLAEAARRIVALEHEVAERLAWALPERMARA